MRYNIMDELSERFLRYVELGEIDDVISMIEHGIDVNSREMYGDKTALMISSGKGYLPIVQLLLDSGADINLVDIEGRTALMYAVKHSAILRILLKNGANPLIRENINSFTAYGMSIDLFGPDEDSELLQYYMRIYRIQAFSRGNLTRRKLHTSMARKRSATSQLGEEYGLGEDIIQMLNSRMTRPTQVDMIDEIPRNMRETLDREPESDEINWEEIFRENPELRPEQSGSGKRKTKKRRKKQKGNKKTKRKY